MNRVLVTAPTEEPLTLEETKEFLREDGDDQDTVIESLIVAARQHVEHTTGTKLITQTWRVEIDRFPRTTARNPWSVIELPYPPLQSITTLKYFDTAGVEQTLATSVYLVENGARRSQLRLKLNQAWPDISYGYPNTIAVTMVVGYGLADAVPDDIKAAMYLLIADLYENREAQIVGTISTDNKAVERLLGPHRVLAVV